MEEDKDQIKIDLLRKELLRNNKIQLRKLNKKGIDEFIKKIKYQDQDGSGSNKKSS